MVEVGVARTILGSKGGSANKRLGGLLLVLVEEESSKAAAVEPPLKTRQREYGGKKRDRCSTDRFWQRGLVLFSLPQRHPPWKKGRGSPTIG